MKPQIVNLHYQDARSDKVYNVELVEDDAGWSVNIAYGRRGSSLNSSTKKSGLEYDAAKKLFDSLVSKKMSKGYRLLGDDTPVPVTDKVQTGMIPQLANSLPWEAIEGLQKSWSQMFAQEKYDGERRMVTLGTPIVASNRTGFAVALKEDILAELNELAAVFPGWILDTEDMGTHLHVFDVYDPEQPFSVRRQRLQALQNYCWDHRFDTILVDEGLPVDTLKFLRRFRDSRQVEGAEGIILRNGDAQYVPGKPNSGGNLIRFKFVESCTAFVICDNDPVRSVQVAVIGELAGTPTGMVPVGNVTIPPNYDVPPVGAYVEIEYLYAYPDGGSLYQPVYKGVRTDKTEADLHSSLKFKRGTNENS